MLLSITLNINIISNIKLVFPGPSQVCRHVSAHEAPCAAFSPALLILSVPLGMQAEDALTKGGQSPQRELWQRFPGGMPGSEPGAQPGSPADVLQEQCVPCSCSSAFPGHKSLCRAQPCCECGDSLPGDTTGAVPSQRQERDLPLSATSPAPLFGVLLLTYEMGD